MSARRSKTCFNAALGVLAVAAGAFLDSAQAQNQAPPTLDTFETLGRALFFDRNLSFSRTQACVSCHSPDLAFTDPRELPKAGGAVSLGADGQSLGDRNAPSIAYIGLTPEFHVSEQGEPAGGFFLDGRARTLEDQAAGPPLNPIEMGMPDKQSIVARLKENPAYVSAFRLLWGQGTLDNVDGAFAGMTKAIAAFERSTEFAHFDSKFDRSLRGEAALTEEEARGREIFFSRGPSSCAACHLSGSGQAKVEVFTNFKYYNLGTPPNTEVRAMNGFKAGYVDRGLAANPAASGTPYEGRFKVPGLRNVAVTGPYMHNGVFKELRTVLLFHGRLSPGGAQIDPETGRPWAAPEVPANLALDTLKTAPALDQSDTNALIAFLKTLTDQSYERLLPK